MKKVLLFLNIMTVFNCISQRSWNDQTVGNGIKPDIDVHGNVALIAYMTESFNGFVKCAEFEDGSFKGETLISTGYFYGPLDIAIDNDGRPRIPYHDHNTGGGDLVVASNVGGNWLVEQVADDGHDGWDGSIYIDQNNQSHVVSVDPGNGIEYATRMNGVWSVERVNSARTDYQFATSIEVVGDEVHVAYYIASSDQLFYSIKQNGIWSHELVADKAIFPSLIIDESGNPGIAYYSKEPFNESVHISRKENGQWSYQKVEDLDLIEITFSGARKSVDLKYVNGKYHIAFNNKKVVRYGTLESSGWQLETAVDETNTDKILGQQISLAIDNNGRPHMAYFERPPGLSEGGIIHYLFAEDEIIVPPDTMNIPDTTNMPDTTMVIDSTVILLKSQLTNGSDIENVNYRVLDEAGSLLNTVGLESRIVLEDISHEAYEICPIKSDNPTKNVSALDLVRAQRMVLGLTQNCKNDFIAGDVDRSGNASALDIILTLNVILGKANHFPDGESWRFYREVDDLEARSLNQIYELGCVQLTEMPPGTIEVKFTGVKLGDITCVQE